MSYLVFARKWRPQNFDDIIGQEHIATTLKNAISLNRVAHAYLFAGPRGIGKTSTARILAKALNCQRGLTSEPCNVCESCLEISQGRSLDVMEIDGASNRGIEQIRQLRENVKFAPAKGRFKVYIIDEVHQITSDGFNALLNTLEEPPAHVKFIFATTQAHKVLPTILSRCQRFNFRPLSTSAITEKLKRIVKEEKLDVTAEVCLYIARAAGGSMRDAESILDQVISFCKDEVNLQTVASMLGMIDLEILEQLAQKIIEKKSLEAFALVEEIINAGKDLSLFVANLMEHFRNILITKIVSADDAGNFVDVSREQLKRIAEQGRVLTLEEIFYIFNILVRTQENLRRTLSARVIVEMAILKLTQRENLSSLKEILARLAELEQDLKGTPTSVAGNIRIKDNPGMAKTPAEVQNQPPPLKHQPQAPADAKELNHNWLNFVQALKEEKMFVGSSLELGQMVGLEERFLTVAFPEKYNFYKETMEHPENKKIIEAKAKEIFQRDLKVRFILDKNLAVTSSEGTEELEQPPKASAEPIIQSALKLFHGRIIKRSPEK